MASEGSQPTVGDVPGPGRATRYIEDPDTKVYANAYTPHVEVHLDLGPNVVVVSYSVKRALEIADMLRVRARAAEHRNRYELPR